MAISLNHYAIRTEHLEACERFYCGLLGLQVGPRPPFDFPGLWIYAGDTAHYGNAVVHIVGIDRNDPEGLKRYLGDRTDIQLQGTGVVDHIAFAITGLAAMLVKLRAQGVPFRERTVPALGLHQLFLDDPNGVVVELNFPASEVAA